MHTKQYLYVATAKIYPQIKLGNGCKHPTKNVKFLYLIFYTKDFLTALIEFLKISTASLPKAKFCVYTA
jgi:hypothetical protein